MKIKDFLFITKLHGSLCALCILCGLSVACTDKLDEVPDNRTFIDSPKKVRKLLTSAYPVETAAVICELSSDNFVDDNVVVPATHNDAYEQFHEEAYKWEDINNYSLGNSDTPYQVWEAYYSGIAVCNHAIEAMNEMSNDPANDPELSHSWGEAHVLRAYLHFILVNLFAEAYKNESLSSKDKGIPYVTEPESVVQVDYSTSEYLHSVKETYDLIEEDILEGISLIDDTKYEVPAYHFNRRAANAFATRFYLFKRDYEKCLKYAKEALGSAPQLRNWNNINSKNTLVSKVNEYNDEKASWNYMLQSTYSLQWRMLFDTPRFEINTGKKVKIDGKDWDIPSTMDVTVWGAGPNWTGYLPAFSGNVYINGSGQEYGAWLFRVYEYFEYEDKIAGIGYVHILYQPFSADETLLCQAEAKLYHGDSGGALSDLQLWAASHLTETPLTLESIKSWYNHNKKGGNIYVSELHPKEMGFEKVLEGDDLALLDCILHFRRIETIHEGMRWYDIKRYGIKVYHFFRDPMEDDIHVDSLTWDDPRRVFQLPNNVIEAGYPPNRTSGAAGAGGSGYVTTANTATPIQIMK